MILQMESHVNKKITLVITHKCALLVSVLCSKFGYQIYSSNDVLTASYIERSVHTTIIIHWIMVPVSVVLETTVTQQKIFGNLELICQLQLLTV